MIAAYGIGAGPFLETVEARQRHPDLEPMRAGYGQGQRRERKWTDLHLGVLGACCLIGGGPLLSDSLEPVFQCLEPLLLLWQLRAQPGAWRVVRVIAIAQ